ncbi:MAG: carboxypeptidase regulatory-like domain-containing protein [Planctomycetes bacterium]|nr:carboxypeptidase regulatory-like domain-containing protein [Planctomycetota bacterium]
MTSFLRAPLLAALAVAAGLGIARAGDETGPATLPIAGVVRDPQGCPMPAVWVEVEGHRNPHSSPPAWRTDVHGRFQIENVPRGPAKVLVTTGDFWAAQRLAPTGVASTQATKEVETRAGVRDLEIVLDPGPQLLVRIVGYVPGEQVRGARVTWEEPDGTSDWRWTPLREDGWARFVALPADRTFELWAEAELDQRHVRATGLKPGDAEQRIERHEVRDIAGKVRASQSLLACKKEWRGSLAHFRVDVYLRGQRGPASGLSVARTRVQSDGSFRVRGLPPGTYRVHAGTHAGEIIDVSKEVEAGTTDVVLDLDERE